MGSDSNHPFDLPDPPPAGNRREEIIRRAVAAFDEKNPADRQALLREPRLRSSTEIGSVRSQRGSWMKREHLALAASLAVLMLSPIVVMRSGMLDGPRQNVSAPSAPSSSAPPAAAVANDASQEPSAGVAVAVAPTPLDREKDALVELQAQAPSPPAAAPAPVYRPMQTEAAPPSAEPHPQGGQAAG